MPEPQIERYEVITPDAVTEDDYGNILIRTDVGDEIRVNKKHNNLHVMIRGAAEEHRAIKLGFAVYKNMEYVHTAELFDGKPPVGKQVEPIKAGVDEPKPPSREDNIELNGWMNRITELIVSNQLSAIFGKSNVPKVLEWYRARFYGNTKTPFDGSKFPNYKTEGE